MPLFISSLIILLALGTSLFPTGPESENLFHNSHQLVVVVSPNETSTTAQLWRFERDKKGWQQVGETHDVNLGRTGLAWGRGLHRWQKGTYKKEGDGKSPAGIFRFGTAFGYAVPDDISLKMKYLQLTPEQICVEDSDSRFYNRVVNETKVKKDWTSKENMRREDDLYKWGIYVEHNFPAPVKSGGSCIFFHLWRAPGSPTLGCTAMTEDNLLALMRWLDPAEKPLLVQLTKGDYEVFREKYGLPGL